VQLDRIVESLRYEPGTTRQLAARLGYSETTIRSRLLDLEADRRAKVLRVGRALVWGAS
jgi:DNA-binding GntR family transcriptional regulator